MICEKILGKIEDFDPTGKKIEYIDIEWAESTKKVHRKQTESGLEVGGRCHLCRRSNDYYCTYSSLRSD